MGIAEICKDGERERERKGEKERVQDVKRGRREKKILREGRTEGWREKEQWKGD